MTREKPVSVLVRNAHSSDPAIARQAARSILGLLDLNASRDEAAAAVAGLLQERPREEVIIRLASELSAQWNDYTDEQRRVMAPAVFKAMDGCSAGTAFVGLGELARTIDTPEAVGALTDACQSADEVKRYMASEALMYMSTDSSDPAVKQAALAALRKRRDDESPDVRALVRSVSAEE